MVQNVRFWQLSFWIVKHFFGDFVRKRPPPSKTSKCARDVMVRLLFLCLRPRQTLTIVVKFAFLSFLEVVGMEGRYIEWDLAGLGIS